MMHKMTVITDANGAFLGAVRTGPVQDGNNTLNFFVIPQPGHTHQEVEVDEEEFGRPLNEARDLLLSRCQARK